MVNVGHLFAFFPGTRHVIHISGGRNWEFWDGGKFHVESLCSQNVPKHQ